MESLQQSFNEHQQQVTLELDLSKYQHLLQWVQKIEENYSDFDIPLESLQNDFNSQGEEKSDKVSTNRLGGQYSTGRPLPMEIREKIVELAKVGLKPCQISKQLLVSHGCVSKLLAKWRKTGTIKPEKIGGSRPKKVLPSVANAITVYKSWLPRLQSWQIKECLIRDGICTPNNVPSVSSINKTLRNKRRVKPDFDAMNCFENCHQEIKRYLNASSTNCTPTLDEIAMKNADLPQMPLSLPLPQTTSSTNGAMTKSANQFIHESNLFEPQLTLDFLENQNNYNQNVEHFDYFISSSSSSSSEYGSMSFVESPPDFGDLLNFLDDVFMD